MIKRAQAVRYDRPAESGRTQPLRVAVEVEDGRECEIFLKPSAAPGLDIEGLANEALAACIGGHVGVPCCEPFLVELTPEWIGSIADPVTRDVLTRSNELAFGSLSAGDGWRPWLPGDVVTAERREAALAVLAFDAFAENPDRRPSNSNLLVKGAALRAIDHEMMFRIRMLLPQPAPWSVGGLNRLITPDGHVLAPLLKGVQGLDFVPIRAAWSALSDEVLADCEACLPLQWSAATQGVTGALTHLRNVRDRIDECLTEMGRVLQ